MKRKVHGNDPNDRANFFESQDMYLDDDDDHIDAPPARRTRSRAEDDGSKTKRGAETDAKSSQPPKHPQNERSENTRDTKTSKNKKTSLPAGKSHAEPMKGNIFKGLKFCTFV